MVASCSDNYKWDGKFNRVIVHEGGRGLSILGLFIGVGFW